MRKSKTRKQEKARLALENKVRKINKYRKKKGKPLKVVK